MTTLNSESESKDPDKPLGTKSYGSIGHLPGSRRGPADRGVNEGQSRICQTKARDKHDTVIVQEKLDGSNVGVVKLGENCIPIIRAGYRAVSSNHYQHRLFADWAYNHYTRFDSMLKEGERVCGEWLIQAHGTRYDLPHEPFIMFDIMVGMERMPWSEVETRALLNDFVTPQLIYWPEDTPTFKPLTIENAQAFFQKHGSAHGAIDAIEGAVWRVERQGKVDFLAKWVDPCKVAGDYFPEVRGGKIIWNTWPGSESMWPDRFTV
jgi:hypothetical protein